MAEERGGTNQVDELAERFEREAGGVSDRAAWEDLRVRWVGRKQGLVRAALTARGSTVSRNGSSSACPSWTAS